MKIFRAAVIVFNTVIIVSCAAQPAERMAANDNSYRNIPPIVINLAKAQESSLSAPFRCEHGGPCQNYIGEYSRYFFDGFIHPRRIEGFSDNQKAEEAAFKLGQVYSRKDPAQRSKILEGYGYVYRETSGVWLTTRHESILFPNEKKDEMWSVCFLEGSGVDSVLQSDKKILTGLGFKVQVKVSGYLSPEGFGQEFLDTPHLIVISRVSVDG